MSLDYFYLVVDTKRFSNMDGHSNIHNQGNATEGLYKPVTLEWPVYMYMNAIHELIQISLWLLFRLFKIQFRFRKCLTPSCTKPSPKPGLTQISDTKRYQSALMSSRQNIFLTGIRTIQIEEWIVKTELPNHRDLASSLYLTWSCWYLFMRNQNWMRYWLGAIRQFCLTN